MGALPSQKYDGVCIALLKYFFRTRCECVEDRYMFDEIDIDGFVREFLRKCDDLEIEI